MGLFIPRALQNVPMIKAILMGTGVEISMLAQNIANYLYAPRVTIKSQ